MVTIQKAFYVAKRIHVTPLLPTDVMLVIYFSPSILLIQLTGLAPLHHNSPIQPSHHLHTIQFINTF